MQSCSQIITPTNQHPVFLQAGRPSCHQTNSVKALKGKISHPMDFLTPSSPGVFQLCLWPLKASGYLGKGLSCLSSALWCQYPMSLMVNNVWCTQVALPELTAGRDFTEPGKLTVRNGDVIIVTASGWVSVCVCVGLLTSLLFSAPCGLRGCKNRPAPFPGWMLYKATKPGSVCPVLLSMLYIVFS